MNSVTIGRHDPTVTLENFVRPNTNPYDEGSIEVTLRAAGLTATRVVLLFGYRVPELSAYLADLVSAWRGWDGVKVWQSPEGDLRIEASSDGGSHNRLRFVVRDGAIHSWTVTVDIQVEAGEETAAIASDTDYLFSASSK